MSDWITDRPPSEQDCHDGSNDCVEVTHDNGKIGWELAADLSGWEQGKEGESTIAWRPIVKPYELPDCIDNIVVDGNGLRTIGTCIADGEENRIAGASSFSGIYYGNGNTILDGEKVNLYSCHNVIVEGVSGCDFHNLSYVHITKDGHSPLNQEDWERESRRVRGQSDGEPSEKFDYKTLPAVLVDGLVSMQSHGQYRLPGPSRVTMDEHACWAADCLKALKEHE